MKTTFDSVRSNHSPQQMLPSLHKTSSWTHGDIIWANFKSPWAHDEVLCRLGYAPLALSPVYAKKIAYIMLKSVYIQIWLSSFRVSGFYLITFLLAWTRPYVVLSKMTRRTLVEYLIILGKFDTIYSLEANSECSNDFTIQNRLTYCSNVKVWEWEANKDFLYRC